MAVAGEEHTDPAPAGTGEGPTGVDRGGPQAVEGAPADRRRALVLALPLVVVLALLAAGGVGYRLGEGSSGAPTTTAEPTTPNTLKAQPVDVGFAADMLGHHEQAVQMSLLVMNQTTNQGVQAHAVAIAVGQRRESGLLEQFLLDRGIEFTDPRGEVMGWMGEPVPADQMPGLASSEDLVALTVAEGEEADRLFLDLMIRHHEGGIHMAEFAKERAESQSMRELAARMVLAQKREVNDLEQLRLELGP